MERRFKKTLLNYGSKIRSSQIRNKHRAKTPRTQSSIFYLAPFAPLRETNNLFGSFAFDHSDLFRVSGFEF